jgi:hypothetical protein
MSTASVLADRAVDACAHGATPGALAAAEVAIRDLQALHAGPCEHSQRARLRLARAVACWAPDAAHRHYRAYVAADRPLHDTPDTVDLALLAEQGDWETIRRWAGDGGAATLLPDARVRRLVPDGAALATATDLLRLHESVSAGRPVPEAASSSPHVVALTAAAGAALATGDRRALVRAHGAATGIARTRGAIAGAVAAATVVLVAASSGAATELPPTARAVRRLRALDGLRVPEARLLRAWLDVDRLAEPAGAPGRSAHLRRALLAGEAHRSRLPLDAGPRASVERALAEALHAAGAETALTAALRASLALDALRRGQTDAARAELGPLRRHDGPRSTGPVVELARVLGDVTEVLGTSWCSVTARAHPDHDRQTFADRWARAAGGLPGSAVAAHPLDEMHPVRVADRAREVAELRQRDAAAFVRAAGALCDDLLRHGCHAYLFVFSLRVAQAETLLVLGRVEHARGVAGYAADRLRRLLPGEVGLVHAAEVAEARARLATGDGTAADRERLDAVPAATGLVR